MIINNFSEYIFSAPSNVSVMRVLNERVAGISGREVARLGNLSIRSAQNALSNLESLGIVRRNIGGRDHLFTLNRNNFISNKIISTLFNSEKQFKKEVFSLLKKKLSKITSSLIIFGSAARKDETPESDMDLCIIFKERKKELENIVSELRDELKNKFSITLAPLYIWESNFKQKAIQKKPPVSNIVKEGIVISGKSLKQLLT